MVAAGSVYQVPLQKDLSVHTELGYAMTPVLSLESDLEEWWMVGSEELTLDSIPGRGDPGGGHTSRGTAPAAATANPCVPALHNRIGSLLVVLPVPSTVEATSTLDKSWVWQAVMFPSLV